VVCRASFAVEVELILAVSELVVLACRATSLAQSKNDRGGVRMADEATHGEDALKDADITSGEEAGKRPAEGSTGDTGDGTGEGDTGQASDGVPAEKAGD
jgi:hypothetical protein